MRSLIKWIIPGILFFILGIWGLVGNSHKIKSTTESEIMGEASKTFAVDNKESDRNREFSLVAGGDVMMSRHVGTKIRESSDNAMPFRKIADLFSQADIAYINLESPFYNQGDYVTDGMVFKTEPEYIAGLELAGIDMASLANNHMRNRGRDGLLFTMNFLRENQIQFSGAGENFDQAHKAEVIDQAGLKIGFLSYTYSDGNNFSSSVSKEDPDLAFMDTEQMKQDVINAKTDCDIIIVSMHAGIEYESYPNQQQKEFARAAIDSGAELVIGHHPHVVQTTEEYNGGFIIYSLGNLVFDQMWSEETREGVIVKCKFIDKDLKEIEFIPIKIENYSQPRLASKTESDNILERMELDNNIISLQ